MVVPNYSSKAEYLFLFISSFPLNFEIFIFLFDFYYLREDVWIGSIYVWANDCWQLLLYAIFCIHCCVINTLLIDIGPQGIVHGTTITLLNAGRKYLNIDSLRGKIFITSGLGGIVSFDFYDIHFVLFYLPRRNERCASKSSSYMWSNYSSSRGKSRCRAKTALARVGNGNLF